jgi:hypothetical protein
MRKSKESTKEKEKPEPPKVDYSHLPVKIKEVVSNTPFIIEKKTKLTWDGNQFSMRIPSEIAKEMDISKENQIKFKLVKPRPDEEGGPQLTIELI